MLTQVQAQELAEKSQTATDNVLKEHYQMYLLDHLFSSAIGRHLIFKGGTALRLAYGSFRFSEDLDFTILGRLTFTELARVVRKLPGILPEIVIKDLYDKRQTYFAKAIAAIPYKPIPLGIKVEVNKLPKQVSFRATLLRSPFNNLEVIGQVYTLEQVLADKQRLLSARREPRDLFDAWYVSQKLDHPFEMLDAYKYPAKELRDKLNPFLPQSKRPVLAIFQK